MTGRPALGGAVGDLGKNRGSETGAAKTQRCAYGARNAVRGEPGFAGGLRGESSVRPSSGRVAEELRRHANSWDGARRIRGRAGRAAARRAATLQVAGARIADLFILRAGERAARWVGDFACDFLCIGQIFK